GFSLRRGNSEDSCFVYSVYGFMLAAVFGEKPAGFAFSEMSIRLNERFGDAKLRGTLLHLHGDHINFWCRHLRTGLPILETAFQACVDVGDLVYGSFLAFETVWQRFECGEPIAEVRAAHTALDAPARRRRIVELLGRVRLAEPERMAAAYPHQLSGGQRQRIMIAMAVALEPALIIADEPTTALDVTTQAQILELIKDIQRQFATGVLFITHDFGVVAEIAHRVAVMRHGRLVEFGPTAEVLSRPREAYTRMLIAAVPGMAPPSRQPGQAPAAAKEEVLRVDSLAKTYETGGWLGRKRSVRAAAGVSLCVRRGETLGIVGESGSGKSTVARCVARLIDPTAGSILIGGQDIARLAAGALRPYRRKVQVIFQDPYRSLNPRRTIRQSLVEGPMNYGLAAGAALERATALLDLVGLDANALDRYPHQFSGGQRQRICIARALAMEPELLIADEPVSALDVSVQAQVLDLIEDVRRRLELAILFITHDLRVAARVCDRVVVMRRGEVVEEGPIEAVFLAPRHDYTRALLTAAPGRNWQFGAP
ncbi:MAG: dipeptide ABC transporter ATP-binding protein, partial [Alphaproteobacteria bacterium]|nr:dipeptide ABC transporter ATP-binding protein [Alphaproteobacteria bacterium]